MGFSPLASSRSGFCRGSFRSWLSFAFFGPGGEMWIAQPLFKSIMVVIGGASGIWLLLMAFRRVKATAAAGIGIGVLWLAINLALDLAILVPMSGMGVAMYLQDIGLRYLLLPIMAAGTRREGGADAGGACQNLIGSAAQAATAKAMREPASRNHWVPAGFSRMALVGSAGS